MDRLMNKTLLLLALCAVLSAHSRLVLENNAELRTAVRSIINDRAAAGKFGDVNEWDTSRVTSMDWIFAAAATFDQYVDDWDTSRVASMDKMFDGAAAFHQYVGGWDTSKVTSMDWIFERAAAFNRDISGWDTSKVDKNGLYFL